MHDYIPMQCYFDYKRTDGTFSYYYLEAVTKERQLFKVADAREDEFFIDNYRISSLIAAMEHGSLINGMTLEELRDSYYGVSDDGTDIDIDDLL